MSSPASLFKGKKVVFVGPSPVLLGSGYGSIIDSYDVVVRTNKAICAPNSLSKDYGSRCNVLYTNICYSRRMKFDPLDAKSRGLKMIIFKNQRSRHLAIKYAAHFSTSVISRVSEAHAIAMTGQTPLLGLLLLCDILQYKPSVLHVCGVDFYRNKVKWVEGYKVINDWKSRHSIPRNISAMRSLYHSRKISVHELSLPYLLGKR